MRDLFLLVITFAAAVVFGQSSNVFQLHSVDSVDVTTSVEAVAFSRSGKYLAVGSSDGQVHVITLKEKGGTGERTSLSIGKGRIVGVSFTGDDALIATATSKGQLGFISLRTWPPSLRTASVKGDVRATATAYAGGLAAFATADNWVTVWDIATGRAAYTLKFPSKKNVRSVLFVRGGDSLVAVGRDGVMCEWDAKSQRLLRQLRDDDPEVQAATTIEGTNVLAVSSQFQTPHRTRNDGASGISDRTSTAGSAGAATIGIPAGTMHPADLFWRTQIKVYDLTTWKIDKPLDGQDGQVVGLTLSPDGRFIGSVRQRTRDSFLDVLDARSGVPVAKLAFPSRGTAAAFSPDARWLASGDERGRVTIYEVKGVLSGVKPVSLGNAGCVITSELPTPLFSADRPTTVAVMDFESAGFSAGSGRSPADAFRARLSAIPRIKVTEREKVVQIMNELDIGMSDRVDVRTAARFGHIIGANKILLGSFDKIGQTAFRISVRVVDVETSVLDGVREVMCQQAREEDYPEAVGLLSTVVVRQ